MSLFKKASLGAAYLLFAFFAASFWAPRTAFILPDLPRCLLFAVFLLSSFAAGCVPLAAAGLSRDLNAHVRAASALGLGFVMIAAAVMAKLSAGFCTRATYAALLAAPIAFQAAVLVSARYFPAREGSYFKRLAWCLDPLQLAAGLYSEAAEGAKNSALGGAFLLPFFDIATAAVALFSITASGLPVINGDALSYHLEIPRQYLAAGDFHFLSGNYYCGHPQMMHMIYSIFMIFGFDSLAASFHGLFLFLAAAMVLNFPFAKLFGADLSPFERRLGALVLLTHPEALMLTTFANVDLAAMFYSFAAALFTAAGSPFLAGAFLGGALSAKYNALAFAAALIAVSLAVKRGPLGERFRNTLIISAVAIVFFLPQPLKNFAFTGNPLYPFFKNVFPTERVACPFIGDYQEVMSGALGDRSPSGSVSFPLLSAVRSDWAGLLRYDGEMGISFFLLIPFFLAGLARCLVSGAPGARDLAGVSGAIFGLYYLYVLNVQSTRQFLPCFPLFALFAAHGAGRFLAPTGGPGPAPFLEGAFRATARAAALAALLFNVSPVFSAIAGLEPFGYLAGQESRDSYLERNLDIWTIAKAYNASAGPRSLLFLPLDQRTYYLRGGYLWNEFCDFETLDSLVKTEDAPPEKILEDFRARGVTHVAVAPNSLENIAAAGENPGALDPRERLYFEKTRLKVGVKKWKAFSRFIAEKTRLVAEKNYLQLRLLD